MTAVIQLIHRFILAGALCTPILLPVYTYAAAPDLAVTSVFVLPLSRILTIGQSYTIHPTVENLGDETADVATLHYYQSTDSSITPGDYELTFHDIIVSLAPGELYSPTRQVEVNAPQDIGSYWIGACVDSDTYPVESNLNNQCSLGVQITVIRTPRLVTKNVYSPTSTSANVGGAIDDFGNDLPSEHGFCWSIYGPPTTADDCVQLGPIDQLGVFTSTLTGLLPGTYHHLRAYATNRAGTGYGNDVIFATPWSDPFSWNLFLPAIINK